MCPSYCKGEKKKMGRDAAKAVPNRYYQARISAAVENERFKSREGASEVLGIGADSLANYENGACKVVPQESVLVMANGYNAPELLNMYCTKDCAIGRSCVYQLESRTIEMITLKMLYNLNNVDKIKQSLMEITVDGVITEDEEPQLREVLAYFEQVEKSVGELKLWIRKNIKNALVSVGALN